MKRKSPLVTVFTPAYNRKHTIGRTMDSLMRQTCKDFKWLIIDDGSTDGTIEWVQTLGQGRWVNAPVYDWMGCATDTVNTKTHYMVDVENGDGTLHVDYIYKPNGGLYTGYNVAYDVIDTELCVCIDSDDFMPEDAVEKITRLWKEKGSDKYCGIEGLDVDVRTGEPIGGFFPEDLQEAYFSTLLNIHSGDTKQVMRTELMREVAPQRGFEGEKNFNPIYMLINVMDRYPLLVHNGNLCFVEYQLGTDSMSQGIFRQYVNSPRSFAKMRLQEMGLVHNSMKGRIRSAIHYVSSCLIAHDTGWLKNSNRKLLTALVSPLGVLCYCYIKWKTRK